jgi:predicted RNase H-like nuclease (RuvC/YqgF family)
MLKSAFSNNKWNNIISVLLGNIQLLIFCFPLIFHLSRQSSEHLMNQESEKLRKDIEKLEAANKSLQSTLQQKSSAVTLLETKIQSILTTRDSLESSKLSLEGEVGTLSANLKTAQDQVQVYRKRIEALEGNLKVRKDGCFGFLHWIYNLLLDTVD